ncbi:hypothetical protein P775_01735 [Puniceibacterium antarcticum]|uniref:Uncharacterized protein n=1 Tax=Puniceibacterium antarcticum TaxID=1206336 RepID=A0A2G8RK70_9RHOB|nr:hypothetical protein [Puniceibacterium antarcticum]PIL21937.1 hypothetical protein P775_01735 [Puniceibacterium antarcticum]
MKTLSSIFAVYALLVAPAMADEPEIVSAMADKVGMGWRISVTLRHADTGWDHYADGWQIEDSAGHVITSRELLHPHLQEQPFTRSVSSVVVPDGVRELFVRAHCSVDGWGKDVYRIELSPDM